jgi:hypothetical protein
LQESEVPKRTRNRNKKREGFLADYKLSDTYLLKPDRAFGRSGLLSGFSPTGTPVLVKIWPRKKGSADTDLEEIWRHELRQLHRLAGFPGASENIAHLQQAGLDDNGFYLVLDPGQRSPLAVLLANSAAGHWIKQPRLPRNRSLIWRNLTRISHGLETLHAQGLLHRNIDEYAVLTSGTDHADFQLTGFEWSMRVTSGSGSRLTRSRQNDSQLYSFRHDWLLFGLLAARLLGVDVNRLLNLRLAPSEIADHISAAEAKLLRAIVHDEAEGRLDGDLVGQRINEVIRSLDAEVAKVDAKFNLVLRVGSGAPLATRIREASGNEIEADDIDAQLKFVADDLAEEPLLMALKPSPQSDQPRLVLRGRHLRYQLRQYVYPRGNSAPTWEFAYCDSLETNAPAPVNVLGQFLLDPKSLEILSTSAAAERFPRLRGKISSWEQLQHHVIRAVSAPSRSELVHRALAMTQSLEVLYAAASVFPVEIVQQDNVAQTADGDTILEVKFRIDTEREALSDALGLKPLAKRLDAALIDEAFRNEGWILTGSKSLGERTATDTEWQFQNAIRKPGFPVLYSFTGPGYVPIIANPFLVPAGSVGRDVQFKRRLKALSALKQHTELLGMLADPRGRILESHDILHEDGAFQKLDKPKQDALRQLTATIPLYLVQGPPGAGKTRLVRDLVSRRFADESTTRLLLTAQSNSAVDHLMEELETSLKTTPTEAPLVVRCRAKEAPEAKSQFEIDLQCKQIVRELVNSSLAKSAEPSVQHRLSQLAAGFDIEMPTAQPLADYSHAASHVLRSFESLVVRAANVVFATTNSAELERLIDDKGQFDWTIVEEAGKATGGELISPLLLSHRRLMIGDHKQLPPFGSEQMRVLLASPEDVKKALLIGEEFIGRSMRDATTEEILDDLENEQSDLPALCAEALRVFTLFESIIEEEFRRQAAGKSGRPIATRLTAQHRMHPLIAELVSQCFYKGEIKTDESRIEFFKTNTAPFYSADKARLPATPIVVIEMPYLQETIGLQQADRLPRWHNPDEVKAVVEVLSLLRAHERKKSSSEEDEKPSAAVLSPYSQQVRRLNRAIEDAWDARLSELNKFAMPHRLGGICGTVDSFQGSEADLVIVSLVRNNQHSLPRPALGFLSDFRRMNVLLSRARWQLILVGSTRFLEVVVEAARGTEDEAEVAFLKKMLVALENWESDGLISKISYSKLLGTTS